LERIQNVIELINKVSQREMKKTREGPSTIQYRKTPTHGSAAAPSRDKLSFNT
jgi:hypothetical protein